MSAQSGITVSKELQQAFQDAKTGDVRVLKVVIEQERLIPAGTLPITGDESEDFNMLPSLLEPATTPAYLLVKLDAKTEAGNDWLLATYVPDHAQVRSKMLYSSSKAALSRQLGDSNFKRTLFASTLDELSSSGYKRFLRHQDSTAPMTDREKEIADLKEAEGTEVLGTSSRRNHAGAQIGMEWDEKVGPALEALSRGENTIVQLGINNTTEKIVLLETPQVLEVPITDPSYTFYAHSSGIVFVYCCPDASPIRGRMMYSSNCQHLIRDAKGCGIDVIKKMETSTPSEITAAFIDAECAPQQEDHASSTNAASSGFARPARPGRKR